MIRSRSVCQGSTGRARPSSSASSATTRGPSSPSGARVPAAPPNCTASRCELTATRPSRASSRLVSQPAAIRPKVTGTACWSSVRPIMIVDRCVSASPATAAAAWARSASTTSMARLASSIAAVSTMSWLVAPRCTAPAAVCGTRRARARARAGTGIAGQRRELAELTDVEIAGLGHFGDRRARARGRQPGPLERPGQPGLGIQHRLQPRGVAGIGAAPGEDPPEQPTGARLLMVGHIRKQSSLSRGIPSPGPLALLAPAHHDRPRPRPHPASQVQRRSHFSRPVR